MEDITDFFITILKEYRRADIAEAEFKKRIHEDPDLRERYREWCHDVGSSERSGFADFCEEYFESEDNIYDSLRDEYDEE